MRLGTCFSILGPGHSSIPSSQWTIFDHFFLDFFHSITDLESNDESHSHFISAMAFLDSLNEEINQANRLFFYISWLPFNDRMNNQEWTISQIRS